MKSFDRIILVDKPAGMSSFGVVARVRRQLTEAAGRKIKVGHAGTLDPFATGLLILVSGKCTRRANELTKLDKVYEAVVHLGATSTTGDPEGEITENPTPPLQDPVLQKVEETLQKFVGKISQTPPIYSAIKIDGQRAYRLARAGQTPKIPPRQVEIYSIDLLKYDYPTLEIRAHVSSGTYIRTLAEDIGQELKTGAYTIALRRIKIGQYDVRDAKQIDELLSNRGESAKLLPV
ncbi:tRNA pseudouridine(55) synthase TruB [Candidatus Saccharibacteria bacterium]|nr:tRNA pseudouridine(55) synthase TruB [Candidatus Saccharibacteria bacterium]